jgi:hypothetical protein
MVYQTISTYMRARASLGQHGARRLLELIEVRLYGVCVDLPDLEL